MITTDTIAGIIDESLNFYYDVFADVLYLRRLDASQTPAYGDIIDDGDILLRDQETGRAVGLTVVSCWKRFGHEALPDSMSEIEKLIEPLAKTVLAPA